METLVRMKHQGLLKNESLTEEKIIQNYKGSIDAGILKVMSKMGISTLASYKGLKFLKLLVLITQSLIDVLLVLHLESKVSRLNTLLKMPYITRKRYPTRDTIKPIGLPKLVNIIGEMVVTHTLTIQLPLPHYRMLFVTK